MFKKFLKFINFIYEILQIKKSKYFEDFFFDVIGDTKSIFLLEKSIKTQHKVDFYKKYSTKNFPVSNSYLISTNLGIFLLKNNNLRRIYSGYTHGLCINNDEIFFSSAAGKYTAIMKSKINFQNIQKDGLTNIKLLNTIEAKYHNERIHGMCYDNKRKSICVANTKRNSILFVNPKNGLITVETFLMKDLSGYFISVDHNHVNNVFEYNGIIFFTMHNGSIGEKKKGGSLIGITDLKKAFFYTYKRRGIHDIFFDGNDLIFCDSFGYFENLKSKKNISGMPIKNGKPIKKNFFSNLKNNYCIRGFGISKDEMLVGCSSISSRRSERLTLPGGLALIKNEKTYFLKCDFSQIFEIVKINSKKKVIKTYEQSSIIKLDKILKKILGKKNFEVKLENKISATPLIKR